MFSFMWIFVLVFFTRGLVSARFCAVTRTNETHMNEDIEEVLQTRRGRVNEKVKKCSSALCYTLWKIENRKQNETAVNIIVSQGCWEASGVNDCSIGVCNPLPSKKELKKNGFCCCSGDYCNMNINFSSLKENDNGKKFNKISDGRLDSKGENVPEDNLKTGGNGRGEIKAIVFGGSAGLVMIFIVISLLLSRRWISPTNAKHKNKASHDQRFSREITNKFPNLIHNSCSSTQLTLEKIIGEGRYGTVWLGRIKDQQVAVKMYPSHYSHYFHNEKDIYNLPFMEHSSFLTYFGCDKMKNEEGVDRLVLVLSYCPLGNLQNYLRGNILDCVTFLKMSLSITAGVAYLHTELHKQGKWKPCVTHRDINTKNILVKEDLSCCIADLGLAIKITGSHYYNLDQEQHAEARSINDVGTLRYMAPEVLEGAVNLRDFESSLKQIDVYALGLVLWELSVRVADFYNKSSDVVQYCLPFEKEVGIYPSLEEMQMLVCRKKVRPIFPVEWKNNQATRTMRETIEDCTDQDGEARLTALCVQERISQICRGYLEWEEVNPLTKQTAAAFSIGHQYLNNNISIEVLDKLAVGDNKEVDGGVSDEGTMETIVSMSPSDSFAINSQKRNLLECSDGPPGSDGLVDQPVETGKHFFMPRSQTIASNSTFSAHSQRTNFNGVDSATVLLRPVERRVIVSPFEDDLVTNNVCSTTTTTFTAITTAAAAVRPSSLDVLNSSSSMCKMISIQSVEDDEQDMKQLKDLSNRIKTPGDLPPSVRRTRRGSRNASAAAARLSLFDDRIMTCSHSLDTTF